MCNVHHTVSYIISLTNGWIKKIAVPDCLSTLLTVSNFIERPVHFAGCQTRLCLSICRSLIHTFSCSTCFRDENRTEKEDMIIRIAWIFSQYSLSCLSVRSQEGLSSLLPNDWDALILRLAMTSMTSPKQQRHGIFRNMCPQVLSSSV